MNDYEHQEDTEAQAEAYYDDQWFKNMEYLEEWDDPEEEETADEVEEINRELDVLDLRRIALENGEKAPVEWTRRDFTDLLHAYPKLRHLKTSELWALFLEYTGSIDQVIYCRRRTMEETRQFRAQGGKPFYRLATWTLAGRAIDELEEAGCQYAFQWDDAEETKLDKIWRNL